MGRLPRFGLRVIVLAGLLYVVTQVVDGVTVVEGGGELGTAGTYLWVGLLFGLVNAVAGPVVRLLSFPFVVLTLGLFLLVVNAALLGLTAALTDRLAVSSFGAAVLGGLLLALGSWLAELVLPLRED